MENHENDSWISNIYWYLQDYSCVLCPRNKKWFNFILPELHEIWNTVLNERKSGYDHRKPRKNKRKKKKESPIQILKIPTQSFYEGDQLSI